MYYYSFNIGDYASHTSRLSPIEDLAYRRLLDLYYLTERPFNGCSTDVAREVGLTEYQSEVDYVLNKFFPVTDGEWCNSRADKEIAKYHSKKKGQIKAGKASGKARQRKASEQTLNGRSTDVEPTNNQEPITNNQVEIKRLEQPAVDPLHFETFWNAGMRKISKKKAQSLFNNLLKKSKTEPAMFAEMLCKDVRARIQANQLGFADMHPTTYLNGERWTDDIHSPTPAGRAPVTQYDPDFVAPF